LDRISRATARLLAVLVCGASLTLAAAAEPLKIGLIASITGPGASEGKEAVDGAMLAAAQANTRGKVVDVLRMDDASQSKYTVSIFRRLADEHKVLAIVGPTLFTGALSVDPVAGEVKMPTLSLELNASGAKNLLRLGTTEGHLIEAARAFAAESLKARKVAALGFADVLSQGTEMQGLFSGLSLRSKVEATEGDLPKDGPLAIGDVDAVLVRAGAFSDPIKAFRQVHDKINKPIVATSLRGLGPFGTATDENAFVVSVNDEATAEGKAFYADFKKAYGYRPSLGVAARSFTAVQMLIQVAAKGARTREDIAKGLAATTFRTLFGDIQVGQGETCSPIPLSIRRLDAERTLVASSGGQECKCGERGCCDSCCTKQNIKCKDENDCQAAKVRVL